MIKSGKPQHPDDYVPALRFHSLTGAYDWVMRVLVRETELRRRSVALVDPARTHRVLDLGCGTGGLSFALAEGHQTINIVGVDIDPDILERAQQKNIRRPDRSIDFIQADVTNPESVPTLTATGCDTVISSLVFHHLTTPGKERALANIARLLPPDGTLSVIDWGPPGGLIQKFGFLLVRLFDGFSVTSANARGELPALISKAGFKNVCAKPLLQTALGTIWHYKAIRCQERK